MAEIKIQVFKHIETGLLMAVSEDVPGFIVHGHSDEEIAKKIVPAYKAFQQALSDGDGGDYELENKSAPGFWPPAFVIHNTSKAAA